jgi:acetyl-CoA acetyltransferase
MSETVANASITGWGETAFGKLPDKDFHEMLETVAYDALERANLRPGDVDGVIASAPSVSPESTELFGGVLAEELGFAPGFKHGSSGTVGGASHVQALEMANHVVGTGQCEHVLVLGLDKLATGYDEGIVEDYSTVSHPEFEAPYGPLIPSLYALAARRHMDAYGTTEEQLAEVAAITYDHAAMQPDSRAFINESKTAAEVLESPMIATPLTIDQCSLVTDGGCAVVVSEKEYAHGQTEKPIDILSAVGETSHESIHQMPDLTTTAAKGAGERAFEEAGVSHDDLDWLGIYDCFTITVLAVLEDLGFCAKGEGGDFVESGAIERDGKWPMNTHGGLLAQSHHGSAGMMQLVEGVRQLRHEAGNGQIDDVETALIHGNGGILSSHTVAILEGGA